MHLPDHVSNSKHDSPTDFSRFKSLRDRIVKPQLAYTAEKAAPSEHAIFWNLNISILIIFCRYDHGMPGKATVGEAGQGCLQRFLADIIGEDAMASWPRSLKTSRVEVLLTEWLLFRMGLHAVHRNWLWTPLCEFSRGKSEGIFFEELIQATQNRTH